MCFALLTMVVISRICENDDGFRSVTASVRQKASIQKIREGVDLLYSIFTKYFIHIGVLLFKLFFSKSN